MTRSELITALTQRFPKLQSKDADISAKEILDKIGGTLLGGHRVDDSRFWNFQSELPPVPYREKSQDRQPGSSSGEIHTTFQG